jgi:hypothetical protein
LITGSILPLITLPRCDAPGRTHQVGASSAGSAVPAITDRVGGLRSLCEHHDSRHDPGGIAFARS